MGLNFNKKAVYKVNKHITKVSKHQVITKLTSKNLAFLKELGLKLK
jgi:hypothetical protein